MTTDDKSPDGETAKKERKEGTPAKEVAGGLALLGIAVVMTAPEVVCALGDLRPWYAGAYSYENQAKANRCGAPDGEPLFLTTEVSSVAPRPGVSLYEGDTGNIGDTGDVNIKIPPAWLSIDGYPPDVKIGNTGNIGNTGRVPHLMRGGWDTRKPGK